MGIRKHKKHDEHIEEKRTVDYCKASATILRVFKVTCQHSSCHTGKCWFRSNGVHPNSFAMFLCLSKGQISKTKCTGNDPTAFNAAAPANHPDHLARRSQFRAFLIIRSAQNAIAPVHTTTGWFVVLMLFVFCDTIGSAHTAVGDFPPEFLDADKLHPGQLVVRVYERDCFREVATSRGGSREQLLWAGVDACSEQVSGDGVVLVDWWIWPWFMWSLRN